MAYVVETRPQRYEVRESRSTAAGPRSRTLASFRELDEEAISRVQSRAKKPPSAAELRKAALRVGAPVAAPTLDRAARQTLRLLNRGESLSPQLKRLLLDSLTRNGFRDEPRRGDEPESGISEAARAAEQWMDAPAEERGRALRELLDLADALPIAPRAESIGFPRLRSV
jgi:hypothetical protein